ncbi:MAG: protease modulator HflC [Alphaproteobacteria bacterium]
MNRKLLIAGIVAVVAAVTLFSAIFVVREDEQALVLQFGQPRRVVQTAGLQFKMPFIQEVRYFDRRVLDFDAAAAEVPTVDQKQLVVDSFARYRIVDPLKFYQSSGTELNLQTQLNNIISAKLRQIFGGVPLAVLLTEERARLMAQIAQQTDQEAVRNYGVNVVDVRIRRIDLPEENSQAIFRRMQTQREQEARRIRAEGERDSRRIRADADKQSRVIVAEAKRKADILRGEGEAEATRLYNDAFGRDRDFFDFYRSMQAMSRGLGGDTTSYVGPPAGDFYRYFEDGRGTASGAGASRNGAPRSGQ